MTVPRGDHDVRITRPWSLDERTGTILLAVLVPSILVLDYVSGRDFSLHLFYLVPTGLAAWSFGSRAGYAVGLVAATSSSPSSCRATGFGLRAMGRYGVPIKR